jgi:hypothetical protein
MLFRYRILSNIVKKSSTVTIRPLMEWPPEFSLFDQVAPGIIYELHHIDVGPAEELFRVMVKKQQRYVARHLITI